jgi:hypothetical protein
VGYDTIGGLLQGSVTTHVILGVLLVKWFIWAVSLGSGTRARHLEEERRRERPLKLTFLIPGARIPKNPASPG